MKRRNRFTALILTLILIFSLAAEAGAAEAPRKGNAELSRDVYVTYNGEVQYMADANGNRLYPISYNGATYLPVRGVGNALGLDVGWDDAAQTVQLTVPENGWAVSKNAAGVSRTAGSNQEITVSVVPGVTVSYNGEPQALTDAAGEPVYPLSYEGVTYLPVRAVCSMLGVNVDWDPITKIVILEGVESIIPTGFEVNGEMVDVDYDAADPDAFRDTMKELGFDQKEIEYHVQRLGRDIKKSRETARTKEVFFVSAMFRGTPMSFEIPVEKQIKGRMVEGQFNGVWYEIEFDSENLDAYRQALRELGFPEADIEDDVQVRLEEEKVLQEWAQEIGDKRPNGGAIFNMTGESNTDSEDVFSYTLPRGDDPDKIRAAFEEQGFTDVEITRGKPTSPPAFKTSVEDAELLGEQRIGTDYVEVDWSTAKDGYLYVKLNKQLASITPCWLGRNHQDSRRYYLPEGQWVKLPLLEGSGEYQFSVQPHYEDDIFDPETGLSDEELDKIFRDSLQLRFISEMDDPDAPWKLSSIDIDYDNAPETRAKALELTKDCETDAEKITAVFEYVAKTVKYDQKLYKEIAAYNKKIEKMEESDIPFNPLTDRFKNGERDYLVLDDILAKRSGVCEDYATLMAGMLRSLGIPCKYGRGDAGPDPKNREPHGWCLVKPETGELNKAKLGAGTDGEWIRLDPTWASTGGSTGRKNASKDQNYITESYY